jgi:peptidoglycan/LPS O-acetylase OafA/YrhL
MFLLIRRIRDRRIRAALAVAVILAGVVIDLLFSAHPAVSIGILGVAALIFVVRVVMVGRARPGHSDRQR